MKKIIFIETFGCQMNQLDSQLIKFNLKKYGHHFTKNINIADLIIYNTCSIRKLSEEKIISRLGIIKYMKINNKNLKIGLLGCMAERVGAHFLIKYNFIDFLIGPNNINILHLIIERNTINKRKIFIDNYIKNQFNILQNKKLKILNKFDLSRGLKIKQSQPFIRITRGCNKFCSFCVVPITRGPEYHKNPLDILKETEMLANNGAQAIILIGQTINHYGFIKNNKTIEFYDLIKNIHNKIPKLKRINFLTSHPAKFNNNILKTIYGCKRIYKYLHIPAQSGSNKILKQMNRGYTIENYLKLIKKIKTIIPNIHISGDLIIGFPGETEFDFQMSMQLLRKVKYKKLFIFKYSKRPKTISHAKMQDNISENEKKRRNKLIIQLQNKINKVNNQFYINKIIPVFIEKIINTKIRKENYCLKNYNLKTKTIHNHTVYINHKREMVGKNIYVTVEKSNNSALFGKIYQ